jgi:hypothetical protein
VTPHAEMRVQISQAAGLMRPVLDLPMTGLDACTVTVTRLVRVSCTPTAAVYIAWDCRGNCRYVGSVCRRRAPAPVRDRVREHLRRPERRAGWYAMTVLPVTMAASIEMVRRCEGWVALALGPAEGAAHPVIDMEMPVIAA